MMILGITGRARHGKDTLANIISEKRQAEILHFADPMKEACKILFNWTNEHVYGDLKDIIDERWGISPRQALQWIGTDAFQYSLPMNLPDYKHGRNHWVELTLNKCIDADKLYLIPDVRFLHEAEAIRKAGGKIYKIVRDIDTNVPDHASESEIDLIEWNALIVNNGSIDDLKGWWL